MTDAKLADLAGKAGPWKQYPKRMLMWRARSFAIRALFADALKGVIMREEAEDIPTNRPVVVVDRRPGSGMAAAMAQQQAPAPERSDEEILEALRSALEKANTLRALEAEIGTAIEHASEPIRSQIFGVVISELETRVNRNGLDARRAGAVRALLGRITPTAIEADAALEDRINEIDAKLEAYTSTD